MYFNSFLVLIIALAGVMAEPMNLKAPLFERKSLLNGMEILTFPAGLERRSFRLMIENGAAFDPEAKWGVTQLTAQMLLEETELRSGNLIRQQLQSLGGSIEFQVHWDAIYFFGSAPEENLTEVLNLLGEVIVRPQFREESFQSLRKQQLEEVQKEVLRAEFVTQKSFLAHLFGENPYGHMILGNIRSLRNLELRDVKIQYKKLFLPNQAKLAIHTSSDFQVLFRNLSRRWGAWIRAEAVPFTFRRAPEYKDRRILLEDLPGDESLFRWGKLAVEMGSRDYYALRMLEEYLTLSLPGLAMKVESETQIQASSRFVALRMPGYIQVSLRTSSDLFIPYLKQFLSTLDELCKGQLDLLRFEESRKLAYLEFRTFLENPISRLTRVLDTSLYDLGVSYIMNYGIRLQRVTAEDFQTLLSDYLSQDSSLLLVGGPVGKLRPKLEEIGPVQILN